MKLRIPRGGRKPRAPKSESGPLKIKLRGKDNAPLTMQELRDGLFEAAFHLKLLEPAYRVKSVVLYLTIVDEDGCTFQINSANELTIYPYKAAADEHGL